MSQAVQGEGLWRKRELFVSEEGGRGRWVVRDMAWLVGFLGSETGAESVAGGGLEYALVADLADLASEREG